MNSLVISFCTLIVLIFHKFVNTSIRKGKIREGFCALWCVDAVFCICGTVVSFLLYHYAFLPFLTVRNLILFILYACATAGFLTLAPSGFRLLFKKRNFSMSEILLGEYRFNDTLCLVRSFFMLLLLLLPVIFTVTEQSDAFLPFLSAWNEPEICGGFCFIAFMILLPVSLRQSFFWLKNLMEAPSDEENLVLKKNSVTLHYRKRNYKL